MTGNRDAGQVAFFFGDLMDLRLRLGLSKMGLAEILGVSSVTIYRWEGYGALARLNDVNAEQVDLFCQAAEKALEDYPDFPERFVTLARAAQYAGVTQEWLMARIRDGSVTAHDFGILGLFIKR